MTDEPLPVRRGVLDRDIYTAEEVAIVLGVSEPTVKEWIAKGRLCAFQFGRKNHTQVRREAIVEYVEAKEAEYAAVLHARGVDRADRKEHATAIVCPKCGGDNVKPRGAVVYCVDCDTLSRVAH